ncbi:MAG: GNAT family N-acetyltransferase [Jatrophihabitantaceae bacterium]
MSAQALVGCRIVLRYRLAAATSGPSHSDLVGELTELTDDSATVLTRRGPVTVARSSVAIMRPIAASRREILDLERICRRGWRSLEQVELDGWLLFADRGWTGRANSVLPLRTPAKPLEAMLDAARSFYAERGLPLQIQLPLPARGLLDAELASRCWQVERSSVVLTADLGALAGRDLDGSYRIEQSDRPGPDWLASYHYRGQPLPAHAAQLLGRHDRVRFITISADGEPVAIARGAVDEGWLGASSVEVAPGHRRRGLASALMGLLAVWATGQGAQHCYLQVDQVNQAALALYAGLGFREHHRYHYRVEPTAG